MATASLHFRRRRLSNAKIPRYRSMTRIQAILLFIGAGAATACHETVVEPRLTPGQSGPAPTAAWTATSDSIVPIEDSDIRSGASANQNRGFRDSLPMISQVGGSDSSRLLLQFDQSAIVARIGSGMLVSATLELAIRSAGSHTGGYNLAVRRNLKSWTEAGATWHCGADSDTTNGVADCGSSAWTVGGASPNAYSATATDTTHVGASSTGVIQFDVTADALYPNS